jgi:hypothetical protein
LTSKRFEDRQVEEWYANTNNDNDDDDEEEEGHE